MMEYQKIINLLVNTPNQLSKFGIKSLVEINNDAPRMYNKNNQTELKNSMLQSSLCNYTDGYILASRSTSL